MAESAGELYGLPLEEFTAARNELAKRDPAVRGLAKPTVPAWTVNQLARRHPDLVARLVESGEAQTRGLHERAPAVRLREAQVAERRAIDELIRRARAVLEEAGRSATAPVLDRIAATLAAGAQTAEGRDALRAGCLTRELEPAGFAALVGIAPEPGRGGDVHDELAARRREKEAAEQRRRELRDEAHDLEAKARAAERQADRAEAAAGKARAAAEKARRRADEAAAALADLD